MVVVMGEPDAETIGVVARLYLTAGRTGRGVRLLDLSGELNELLALAGLSDVVSCEELVLEPGRQTEQREPPRGVQEERDPADPVP